MTETKEHAVSRRTFLKGSALAGLGARHHGIQACSAARPSRVPARGTRLRPPSMTGPQVVWTHCAVNCGSCCALQCHVKDGEIVYVESDNTGSSELGDPQLRACLRGRSIRRWLQSPDRLNTPLKRVEGTKRGDGKYEEISWDEALDTIASEMKRIRETYGDEAMTVHYGLGRRCGPDSGQPGQAPDEPYRRLPQLLRHLQPPRIFPLREPTLTAVAPTAARCSPFRMASWWSCSGTARRTRA